MPEPVKPIMPGAWIKQKVAQFGQEFFETLNENGEIMTAVGAVECIAVVLAFMMCATENVTMWYALWRVHLGIAAIVGVVLGGIAVVATIIVIVKRVCVWLENRES